MGKKIVVLTGSPRAGGNTDRMADAFISGAMAAGHEVTKFSTAQLRGLRRLLQPGGPPLLP